MYHDTVLVQCRSSLARALTLTWVRRVPGYRLRIFMSSVMTGKWAHSGDFIAAVLRLPFNTLSPLDRSLIRKPSR